MIIRNSLTKSDPNPFKWWENDRVFCSCIIDEIEISETGSRLEFTHIDGLIIIKIDKFRAQNLIGEIIKMDLVAGSNDEKMSTIMLD